MKKLYIILSFILCFTGILHDAFGQTPYVRPCYSVNAGADVTQCSETCLDPNRTAIPQYDNRATNTYTVQQMTLPNPTYNTFGTNVIVDQDDIWSGVVNIGFNFCFFGTSYNRLVIGANGLVSFNLGYAGAYCPWSYTGGLPDGGKPINSIMGPYTDIDPSVGFSPNRINYYTEGVYPCRRFVINFYRIPMFSCTGSLHTSQIILHEAYNIIDVVINSKPVCSSWNGGRGIIGIQNAAGSVAFTAPGNNPSTSALSNTCFRFYPNGALQQSINWTDNGTVVSNNALLSTSVCPNTTKTYVANLVNNRCDGSTVTVSDTFVFRVNALPAVDAGPDKSLSCISPNVTIGTPSIAGYTYSWSPAGGLSNPNIAQPTTNTPNTYILTMTNTLTSCTKKDTVVISPLRFPTANAGPDKTITCLSPTVSIGTPAVVGFTYSWAPAAGLNNSTFAQPNASQPNTYTLTIRNDTTGCTATDPVTVSIDTVRPVANAGSDQTLTCSNVSFVIGTPSVGGNTYSWSPPAGLSNAGIAQPTASLPNNYTLTVTKASNGCTSTDAVLISQNIAIPVANAGIDRTLTCATNSYVIGAAPVAGNTYSWSPPAGLSDPNIAQPTATLPNTYILTVTNTANNCVNTDTVVISRDTSSPSVDAGPDKIITCANPTFVIGTAAIAGQTYSWAPPAGLSNPTIAQPTASTTGTFTVTATKTVNGCTKSDAVTITVDTIRPAANATADKTITCANPNYVIGAAAVAGNTYAWAPPAGLSNPAIAQPTVSAGGTYTLTVTNTANGCTSSDAVTISVDTTRPAANAGVDRIITCANPSYVIGAAAVAGNTYSWSPAGGLSNPAIAQPTVSQPNTYTLTVTNTTNNCVNTDVVDITRDTTSPSVDAGPDKIITCANPNFVIGTAAIAGQTYSWAPPAGLSNPTIAQPTASTTGTFTVTATKTVNGCTKSDAVTITVDTIRPAANATADKTITCANPNYVIGAAAVAGNTYAWAPPAGLSNPAIAQPTVSAGGTYTLTVTNTANGCTSSDAVTISVDTTRPAANAGVDRIITCANPSYVIGAAAVAGNTYSWAPPAGLSDPNIAQPTVSTTGTYTLTVTKTVNSCTASDAVTISVDTTRPAANAGADQTLTCTNTSFIIGTAAVAGNTYAWTPPAGLSNPAIARPTVSTTGTFTLTVTKSINGCSSSDDVTITVDTIRPGANAGADKLITCTDPTHVIGTAAIVGNTYSWTPATGLSDSAIAQPTASTTGTYTLTVTKIVNGCTSADAMVVSVDTSKPVANAGTDKTITCTNPTHVIGTAAIAGNTYAWAPPAGLSNPAIAQPTASTTGTFTLTVTKTANGCTKSDDVVVAVDTSRPVANAGADKVITCANPTHIIGTAASAGNTYAWAPPAGLSDPASARPTVSTTGTYTLTVTKTANGCTASDAVLVSVDTSRPAANAGADKIITCANPTHVIGNPAIAGNTYAWTPPAGLSNPASAQPTVSTTGTFTLTVTQTSNGCSKSDAVVINVDTIRPIADAGADKIITCANPTHVIGTPFIAGNTYAWAPPAGLSNPATAQPTASSTGTYTLTVTRAANGCTALDAMVVSVDTSRPVANAGADKIITCANPTHVIGSPAIAGNSYSWAPPLGLSDPATAQPTASSTSTYTLTVTKSVNGCTASDAVVVSVDTTRPLVDAGTDKIITCDNPTHVIGAPAIAGQTYSWAPPLGLNNPAIAQPTASTTGTYTLTVTKSVNGCTALDAMVVSVDTSRPVANAGADKIITCANPTHVIGSPAIAGNTYSWAPPLGLSDPAIAQPTASTTGTYTVTVTKSVNGCTALDAMVVSVDTSRPVANAGVNKIITCANTTHVIGTAAIAGNTYAWTPPAGLSNPAIAQPTASATGTFTLTVTQTANGCTKSDVVIVSVDTIHPAANAGADKIITCANPTHVIGTPAVAGNTYAWTPPLGLSDPALAQPTASTTGTYTVTVTKTVNGCTNSDAVKVAVDTSRPVANAGADKIITCTNPTHLIGSPAIAGNTYAWAPPAGLSDPALAQPTASSIGTFTLTVTKSINGCTASDVVLVDVDTTKPVTDAGPDKTLTCVVKSVVIGSPAISANTYKWTPASGLNNTTAAQPVANAVGTYSITVTKSANGCTDSDIVNVTIDTITPLADAGPDQTLICININTTQSVTLGVAPIANMSYAWTPAELVSDNTSPQPSTNTSGTYAITVTNDINGCKAHDTTVIDSEDCFCDFYVPSAFSPNNDGVNDLFFAFINCDKFNDFAFSIFNRWGELVFKTNDIALGWDGIFKGEPQQVDSYEWVVEYFDVLRNKRIFKKGIVTLIR